MRQIKNIAIKIAPFLCVFLMMCFAGVLPVSASESEEASANGLVEPWTYTDGSLCPVTDEAYLLSDDEINSLCQRIESFQEKNSMCLVILTVDSLGNRTAMEYADDFYDYGGFSYNGDNSGVILIIGMEDRSWQIETTGRAIGMFTDSDIAQVGENILNYLSDGYYYDAFNAFIDSCQNTIDSAYYDSHFTLDKFFICVIIGFILAFLPLLFFIKQLHTVHFASGAANYKSGGLNLTKKRDQYLRHHLTRVRIQHDDNDGGGTSTHTGSSGTSHGGGGGHF